MWEFWGDNSPNSVIESVKYFAYVKIIKNYLKYNYKILNV